MPRRQRGGRGQVLPIFAVFGVVLFGVTGLSVDAGLSYLGSNLAERAAGAAALAGVAYMPGGFATTANAAAKDEAARNGFTDGDNSNGRNVTVVASQYPAGCGGPPAPQCASHKLTVTVSETVTTSFMQMIGLGSVRIAKSDTAFYLPPIQFGQPGSQLGSDLSSLGHGVAGAYYFIRQQGWGVDRNHGDAFTPDPNAPVGPSCDHGAGFGSSTDQHLISENNSTDVTNAVLTGAPYNFSAVPKRGGYNYLIHIPAGVGITTLQVYNPSFAPDGQNTGGNGQGYNATPPAPNPGNAYNMHEQDNSFDETQHGTANQYSVTEYTVFRVNSQFDHTQDTPLFQELFNPVDAVSANPTTPPASYTDMNTGQTVTGGTQAAFYHSWTSLMGTAPVVTESGGGSLVTVRGAAQASLASGYYRLRVDLLDNQGLVAPDNGAASICSQAHKGYALRVNGPAGTPASCNDGGAPPTSCSLSGLSEFAYYTPFAAAASFDMPIMFIPAEYSGTTVNVYAFDAGDISGSGSGSISIIDPETNNPVTTGSAANPLLIYNLGVSRNVVPVTLANGTCNGSQVDTTSATVQTYYPNPGCPVTGVNIPFDSQWLLFQVQIPSAYSLNEPNGAYWNLRYSLGGGGSIANDTVTMAIGFGGAAVHLLP